MKNRLNITGALLLGIALLGTQSCGSSKQKDKEVETSVAQQDLNHALTKDPDNYPVITVADSLHEFGDVKQGSVALYSYRLKNTGSKPLIIDKVESNCSCTVSGFPEDPIAPGKESRIDVQFFSEGLSGKQIKPIFIHANTQPELSQLTITINVITPEEE